MIIDTSAIIALIQSEPSAVDIAAALVSDPSPRIAAPSATECLVVLAARYGPTGRTVFERVRQEFAISTVSYTEDHVPIAHRAYVEFGKGGHPAALNFGDCMTYAVAKHTRERLLAVGDDYPQTDLIFDGYVGDWPVRAGEGP